VIYEHLRAGNTPALPRLLAAILVLLTVSGCATLPKSPDQSGDWRLSGKLAVVSPRASGSGQLEWWMAGEQFDISLRGPLGVGALRLTGSAEAAELSRAGETLKGSFSELAEPLFGAALPITALQHWTEGRTAPPPLAAASAEQFDPEQRLIAFSQAGWTLQLSRYAGSPARPAKLVGRRGDERFTLIVQARSGQR